ncbi:MAG: hypothetical protein H7X99_09990, partial [Saprospiraceae bacterium]|nr:hypothetical protein [Saprospiraceae bacterium]
STFIKASNKINLNNEHMEDLEFSLQSLLQRINDANIFVKPFEINTISFRKQVDFVSNLVKEMDIMMLRISQNLSYYQWLSFLSACNDRMKKVIQVLRRFDPEDWTGLFKKWYHYEILSRNVHSEIALTPANIEKTNKLHLANQQSKLHHSVNASISVRQQALTELKQTNPEFYQAIIKNKKYQQSPYWKHILEENTAFFSLSYPVIILDDDDIKNMKPGHYTALYYVNPTSVNVDILQDYKTIHTYKKEEDFDGIMMDVLLKTMYIPTPGLLSSLTLSERLPVIKKIANHLLSVGKEPVIFHLRYSSIISYSGDFFNDLFEEKLYHFGIKKILLDQNVSDTLVATMLDVTKTAFFITEDLLLHPEDNQNYLWQSHIIHQAALVGCQWLNIDHMQLFYRDMEAFDLVLDAIKAKNEIKTDPKKQIVLEFSA